MTRSRWIVCVLLVLLPGRAFAWDTNINSKDDWKSIYETEQSRFCQTKSYHPNNEGQPDDMSTHGGGNEHAEIADDTLWVIDPALRAKLGIDGEYGLSGDDPWMFVDLNATFRRHFDFEDTEVERDDPTTVFEERALGDLVRYAGIPDFNYSIYDWINKSVICPAIPPDLSQVEKGKVRYDLCHLYTMWKGAALNSSHFGSLATKMWVRHHKIALALAKEAKAMREDFGEEGMVFYEDFVKEAELMSLMYEMAGQHFLQDRWSTGHMFSRWGPGGYEDIPRDETTGEINLASLLAAGMFTGIVHGSEAVFGFPDPVSSPYIDENVGADDVIRSGFSYAVDNRAFHKTIHHDGLGDYRFGDLIDGVFDGQPVCSRRSPLDQKPLIDPPAHTQTGNQSKMLRYCTSMAMREVIAGFGNTKDDQYGALDIKLTEPAGFQLNLLLPNPGSIKLGVDIATPGTEDYEICQDAWLDNKSFYLGYTTVFGTGKLLPGKDLWVTAKKLKAAGGGGGTGPSPPAVRVLAQLTKLQWAAERAKLNDENEAKRKDQKPVVYGTQTARIGYTLSFGLGSGLGRVSFRPNNNYDVPAYVEPEDLDTLPADQDLEHDDGRTRWTIDGFFNRARARAWCDGGPSDNAFLGDYLDDIRKHTKQVRDVPRQKELATCAYLAGRLYKQTDPRYPETGDRFERIGDYLPFGETEKFGAAYEPACFYLDPLLSTEYENEKSLYYIHPGFVEEPGKEATWDIGAPDGDKRGLAPQTLKNWCNRIPVIDFTFDDDAHPNKVGEIGRDLSNGFRWAVLTGANFGLETANAIGTVEAIRYGQTDWSELNIYNPDTMEFAGGWSRDKTSISPQIPGSLEGFPSSLVSTAGDPMASPELIKYAAPQAYQVRLTQANDPAKVDLYDSFGRETVGTYEVLVYPTFEESIDGFAGLDKKAFYATWPEWVRPSTEILAMGLYIVSPDPANPGQDIYTPVTSAPITQTTMAGRFVFDVSGNASVQPSNDEVGILLEQPGGFGPELTNNTIAWIFAYH